MNVFFSVFCFLSFVHVECSNGPQTTERGAVDGQLRLDVVTSSSDTVLGEALGSTDIQLRVTFTDEQNGEEGISLFGCMAELEGEGEKEIQLTDIKGCPALNSPMGCMVEENGTVISPVFPLSSLADGGLVNITCSWETCPASHHPKCVDRCDFFSSQRARPRHVHSGKLREKREKDETPRRTISTTIRVLPSHARRHHHGTSSHHHRHHGAGHEQHETPAARDSGALSPAMTGPLLYLNPITCSLFLFILSVFLGLHVSFLRSLRRSVEDIKREIDAQRSRDRFLVH